MFASNCINREIPFLQPEDKGLTALSLMEELKITEMPLVDNDNYVGIISELDLLDYECIDGQLKDLQAELNRTFVHEDDHLFEVIGKLATEDLTVLPVISRDEKYVGAIDLSSALREIAKAESFRSNGGVIMLEMNTHDYSLAEISRLVESNDAKILYLYVASTPDSKKINIIMKLNRSELNGIIQTFNRFNYTIIASFQQDEYEEDLRQRYEGFLRYLNI